VIRKLLVTLLSLIVFAEAHASDFGASLLVPVVSKDPPSSHAVRVAVTYQPQCFVWHYFSLYFDASYGHWWISKNVPNSSLNIFAAAPYIRMYYAKKPCFAPYIELSVGPSYLSNTRFGCQNLGMHFAFQDQLSIGSAFGKDQRYNAAFTILHYSNASMANANAGITSQLALTFGCRF
jgi:hypothetical protein